MYCIQKAKSTKCIPYSETSVNEIPTSIIDNAAFVDMIFFLAKMVIICSELDHVFYLKIEIKLYEQVFCDSSLHAAR